MCPLQIIRSLHFAILIAVRLQWLYIYLHLRKLLAKVWGNYPRQYGDFGWLSFVPSHRRETWMHCEEDTRKIVLINVRICKNSRIIIVCLSVTELQRFADSLIIYIFSFTVPWRRPSNRAISDLTLKLASRKSITTTTIGVQRNIRNICSAKIVLVCIYACLRCYSLNCHSWG